MAQFAVTAVEGRTTASAKARALYDALTGVIRDGRLVPDRDNAPKERTPLTAEGLWARVKGKGDAPLAGCYELTILYIAMARAVGLDARGAEPQSVQGTGAIGHVLVAVEHGDGGRSIVDLQNQAFGRGPPVRLLSDAELTAHHYNHLAVASYLRGDVDAAAASLAAATAIADTLPQVASNAATLAARQGDTAAAVAHARRAVTLAPNAAVYRYQLGHALIDAGALCAGLAALREALHRQPGYPEARALSRATLEAHPKLTCAAPGDAP